MEDEEVVVAADDRVGTGRQREFEVFVVVGITAIGDTLGRIEPNRSVTERIEKRVASPGRYQAHEFRSAENVGDFGLDGG